MRTIKLSLPLSSEDIAKLQVGDKVLLNGEILTARDKAHARFSDLLNSGQMLLFNLAETTIFYCGPSPATPKQLSGAIGPTTSGRMDRFTPLLLEHGLRVMIGKGERSPEVASAIKKHEALYLVAVGGVSALLSRCVVSRETFLWSELGSEAVYRLVVHDFPCYVALV